MSAPAPQPASTPPADPATPDPVNAFMIETDGALGQRHALEF
jgi:hypothetical protein